MNQTDRTSDPVPSNDITRRSFMKKSALTAGAITLLGRGIGLAEGESGGPYSSYGSGCYGQCKGFTPEGPGTPTVYVDESCQFNDPNRYFIKGTCHCKCLYPSNYDAWQKEMPPGLDEPEPTSAENKNGLVEHTSLSHKLHQ